MKEFELTYFVKKRANPSWHLDNDQLPFCDLTFLLDGEATYSNNRQTFHLLPGEAVFLPAGSKRFATTTGMECVAFSFAADAWSPGPPERRSPGSNPGRIDGPGTGFPP